MGETPESKENLGREEGGTQAIQARAQQKETRAGQRDARADAEDEPLGPVALSVEPLHGRDGPLRLSGVTEARWYGLLALEPVAAPCTTDLGEKRRA
jgi:hypothetical protein